MAAVGLALWPVNTLLALLASLAVYVLGILFLRAFTANEMALISGRRRRDDVRE